MKEEAKVTSRRFLKLCARLIGGVILVRAGRVWLGTPSLPRIDPTAGALQGPASVPIIEKQPVNFVTRTFDPAAPPPDMPPMAPGEEAACESNFKSNASVSGQSQKSDATHATMTITQVKVTLGLDITIWTPPDVTPHVMEHEQGHRQISEYYYQTADKLAEQIAGRYMGRQVPISGPDLDAASTSALQQMSQEITDEYNRELNPDPAQLRFDAVTDHSRNNVVAQDAVAQILRELMLASNDSATNPGN
jgi:hypothetical protein